MRATTTLRQMLREPGIVVAPGPFPFSIGVERPLDIALAPVETRSAHEASA